MYNFYSKRLEPFWQNKVHFHYLDTDVFVLSFDTNNQELKNLLQQNKVIFDSSELDKSHELYNPITEKVIGKMKIETSPVLVLDSCTALRSKSYTFSYNIIIQKAKQKVIQKAPKCKDYKNSLFMSETTNATNCSIHSNLHQLSVEKQNKLALNPFDDKRKYLNPIQSLPWDEHTQKSDCPCIFCLKVIGLYYEDFTENCKTDKKFYLYIWYWKQTLNHQELLKLICDRAHLL